MAQFSGNTSKEDTSYNVEAEFRKHQGNLLKRARKTTTEQYSQAEVGAHFGLSQDTISKIEKGEQSVSSYRLLEFARLYKKPVTFFYMVNTADLKSSKSL